jgi:NADH:ubiquinone oxidoreductase subunit 4 (subunit M)
MPDATAFMIGLGGVVIAAPLVLVMFLGVSSLLDLRLTEQAISKAIQAAISTGLLAALGVLTLMLVSGERHVVLYEHSPMLAVSFLLTGLASVGFPSTFGFVAADLLVEGALGANLFVGLVVIATEALNGIAILRVYLLLFTGARHTSTVSLELGPRERIVVLTLAVLILGGGVFPQPCIASRRRAANAILSPSSSPSHSPLPKPRTPSHGWRASLLDQS